MPFDLAACFVEAAERELGSPLPAAYVAAMRVSNGGEIDALDDEWHHYPIADTSDRKRLSRTANHLIMETSSLQRWRTFPAGALAIAGNGSGDQLIFLRDSGRLTDAVHHWCHETGAVIRIADNFAGLSRA